MAVRIRIGTKIFALALSLLALTVGLSAFATLQSRALQRQLVDEAVRDIPLQDAILSLNEHALQRRLEFERWKEALELGGSDSSPVVQSSAAAYQKFNDRLIADFARVQSILQASDPNDPQTTRIRTLADTLQRDYSVVAGLQQRVIASTRAKNMTVANELIALHDKLQENLRAEREDISQRIQALSQRASEVSEQQEKRLITVIDTATGFAILLGLVFAWLMTKRMVSPVHALVDGVRSVERGDLAVKIPVQSSDEIGVLANSFNSLVEELKSKETLKATFGKYLDPRIVENVMLNPSAAEAEGGRRVMTVSFCDLVGFTEIGEQLTPSGLVRLLNRHFALMADAIHEHQGVLDKLIGDAVMAFWGPPFCTSEEHAKLACFAALQQISLCNIFRAELPDLTGLRKSLPNVDLRIGLAAGEVVIGNIGAESAKSYTVIGDTVNLASRLESINRVYGTNILLNREVRKLVGEAIETREIDSIAVKGKKESVEIFELLGVHGSVEPQRLHLRDTYELALGEYRRQNWSAAITTITQALQINPQDRASMVLLDRSQRFQQSPPAKDWDGVWHFPEK